MLPGPAVLPPLAPGDLAMLPPMDRQSEVLTLKGNAFYGLPTDTSGFREEPYRASLGLDYISQPSLAVGFSSFGTYLGGGASLFWSDELGGHNLATALQVQGSARDIAGLVGYTNTYHRLNWGMAVQQIPYLSVIPYYPSLDSSGAIVYPTVLFRQTQRTASWIFSYPFSRVQRIEGNIGYANITYNFQEIADYYDPTAFFLNETNINLGNQFGGHTYNALNLGQASMALVYDNSFFGYTSPILGQRYRLEPMVHHDGRRLGAAQELAARRLLAPGFAHQQLDGRGVAAVCVVHAPAVKQRSHDAQILRELVNPHRRLTHQPHPRVARPDAQ